MATGSTLPQANPVEVGDVFYKLVPQNIDVGPQSAFWTTEDQISSLRGLSSDEVANRLGLPLAQQQGGGFRLFRIRATSRGISFTSRIAPTSELGAGNVLWTQNGGANQVLLTNRRLFGAPELVESLFY